MDRALSEWADMVKGRRWGRVREGVRSRLRRGAWCPVLSAGSHSVVLDVRGMSVSVHHAYLELTVARPTRWGIVARPPDAGLMPESWGAWYAVCPGCAARSEEHTSELQSRLHLVCRLLLEKKKQIQT